MAKKLKKMIAIYHDDSIPVTDFIYDLERWMGEEYPDASWAVELTVAAVEIQAAQEAAITAAANFERLCREMNAA